MDPELEVMRPLELPSYRDVGAVREWLAAMTAGAPKDPGLESGIEIENRTVPGLQGEPDVGVRIYRPEGKRIGAMVYCHSGSMIMGDLETEHAVCIHYARLVGCVVVAVDYRLSPENPYPAALHDSYAALLWTSRQLDELGVEGSRVAVVGHSSGGTLAAAMAIMARDRGDVEIALQMMIYAALDDRLTEPSMHQPLDFDVPSRTVIGHMWRHYLGGAGTATSPYQAPARVADRSGLAPAYVEACAIDRVRDEAIEYATRLLQAGVPADLHVFAGAIHAFDTVPDAHLTKQAFALRGSALKRAFGKVGREHD